MINYISKTGLNFVQGQPLKTSDLNTLNRTINELVDVVNCFLRGVCDINTELGTPDKEYTLLEAIKSISNQRRQKGLKIRFRLKNNNKYTEYSYIGKNLDTATWEDINNWVNSIDLIDGGEFE